MPTPDNKTKIKNGVWVTRTYGFVIAHMCVCVEDHKGHLGSEW